MPSEQDILARFRNLTTWSRGDQRAPHKPLLVLMALARLQAGQPRWKWSQLRLPLSDALADFGTPGTRLNPHYPFWRLQADRVWEVAERDTLAAHLTSSGDVQVSLLDDLDPMAGFPSDIEEVLRARADLVNQIAAMLLEAHFPPSVHEDLLDAVGFPWVVNTWSRRRDPAFRERILTLYERRCAVCGYDGRMGRSELGLEAAHIKWHSASGPDTDDNGLALCVFHHRAFDRGAVGIDADHRLLVSAHATGSHGVIDWLHRYAGAPLRPPIPGMARPRAEFIQWHRAQVFREPARQAE